MEEGDPPLEVEAREPPAMPDAAQQVEGGKEEAELADHRGRSGGENLADGAFEAVPNGVRGPAQLRDEGDRRGTECGAAVGEREGGHLGTLTPARFRGDRGLLRPARFAVILYR